MADLPQFVMYFESFAALIQSQFRFTNPMHTAQLKQEYSLHDIQESHRKLRQLLTSMDAMEQKHRLVNTTVIHINSVSITLLRFIMDKFIDCSHRVYHCRKLRNTETANDSDLALEQQQFSQLCDAYWNIIDLLLQHGADTAYRQMIDTRSTHQSNLNHPKSFSSISHFQLGLVHCYTDEQQIWRKYLHILSFALPYSGNRSRAESAFNPPILRIEYVLSESDGYALNSNLKMSFFADAFQDPFECKKHNLLSPARIIQLLWKGHDLVDAYAQNTGFPQAVSVETVIEHFCGGCFEYVKELSPASHGHDNPKSKLLLLLLILKTCYKLYCDELRSVLTACIAFSPQEVTQIVYEYLVQDMRVFDGLGMNYLCGKAFEYFPALPYQWQLWSIAHILDRTDANFLQNIETASKHYYYWPHYISYLHFYVDRCDQLIEYLLSMYQGPWNATSCFTTLLWKYRDNAKIVELLMNKRLIQPMCKASLIYDLMLDDTVKQQVMHIVLDGFYRQNNRKRNSLNLSETITHLFGKMCEDVSEKELSAVFVVKLKLLFAAQYDTNWIDVSFLLVKLCKNHALLQCMMQWKLLDISQCLCNVQSLRNSLIKFGDSELDVLRTYVTYLGSVCENEQQQQQLRSVYQKCVQAAIFRENTLCAQLFSDFV